VGIHYVCSADGNYEVSYKPNVLIFNTGKIDWIPIAIYKSSCIINVQYFPFDEQTCDMEFGSWTFNAEQVTLDWYEGERKVCVPYALLALRVRVTRRGMARLSGCLVGLHVKDPESTGGR